jgi:hypothetical protein
MVKTRLLPLENVIIKKIEKIKQYQQNKKQKTKKIYLKERIPIKFKLPSFKWKKRKKL